MRMGTKILAALMFVLPVSLAAGSTLLTPKSGGGPRCCPALGEAFVDALIRELHSEDARSRYGAVHALAESRSPFAQKALPVLHCMLYDEHPLVCNEAARAIGKIDLLAMAVQKRSMP